MTILLKDALVLLALTSAVLCTLVNIPLNRKADAPKPVGCAPRAYRCDENGKEL